MYEEPFEPPRPPRPRPPQQSRTSAVVGVLAIGIFTAFCVWAMFTALDRNEAAASQLAAGWNDPHTWAEPYSETPAPTMRPPSVYPPDWLPATPEPTPAATPATTLAPPPDPAIATPDPITPAATPKPQPQATAPASTIPPAANGNLPPTATVPAGWFGPKASLAFFDLAGSTHAELEASWRAVGQPNFAGEYSSAWVQPKFAFNISYRTTNYSDGRSECQAIQSGGPSLATSTYTVNLPRWTPPASTSVSLVEWWNTNFAHILEHERHHIDLYEGTLAQINAIDLGMGCDAVDARIDELTASAEVANCEFDVAEYGAGTGATVEDCLAGH